MRQVKLGRGVASCVLAGAAVSLSPPRAWAEDRPAVSEVVVTASHFRSSSERPTTDATVVSPDAAPVGATLADLLETVSDVAVQRPGGAAGTASIFLRGAKPNFTMVMIEGVPLNDQTNSRGGSADVSGVNLLGVERVEVVRGALSSIYGSGAVQGAVNLIAPGGTPRPSATGVVEAATDRGAALAVSARGPLANGAGGSLTLDWDDAGHDVEGASRVNQAILGKIAPLDGSDRYGLVARVASSIAQTFPDSSGGPRLSVRRITERTRAEQALLGAHWRFDLRPGLDLEVGGAGVASAFHDNSPGVAPGPGGPSGVPAGTSQDRYNLARGQAILRYDPDGAWRALAGVEVQREHGEDVSNLTLFGLKFPSRYSLTRTTPAAFVEADLDQGGLSMDASVRIDRPGDLGAHATGRLGVAARLAPQINLHLSWGRSFKAPSFFGLANGFVGNPGLKPEAAETSELGLAWIGGPGLKLDANLFHIQYHQLVDFDPGPPPRLVNRTSVLSQGAQVSLTAPLGQHGTVNASATYIDTRNQANRSRLLELPAWRVTSSADWRFTSRLRGRLDAIYVGDRLDAAIPTGLRMLRPYTLIGARLTYGAEAGVDVEVSLENAFDRRYEDAIGFPMPGVVGRLSLRRRF